MVGRLTTTPVFAPCCDHDTEHGAKVQHISSPYVSCSYSIAGRCTRWGFLLLF